VSDSTFFQPALPTPNSGDPDSRPLPEIIAEHFGFPLAYHDVKGVRYYAVQDWILGVAQPDSHPGTFWTALKRRTKKQGVEFSTLCIKLPYIASDGKRYKTDHAKAETLYMITQRMDANTGLRNKILEFLAKSGVVLDEVRIDPERAIDAAIEAYRRMGKSEDWIATRIQSRIARLKFTSAFKYSLLNKPTPKHYAVITDELRLGLWRRKTAELRRQMGLKENANLRDHQSSLALSYELLAENLSAAELAQKRNLAFEEVQDVVRTNAEDVGRHAQQAGQRLGIDIATNRPLLRDGDR